jgi:type IV pilus assembly protein PilE
MNKYKYMYQGFTLVELMIVVAIIGILSMIAVPKFMNVLAKSKRAEAYVNLSSLAMAEKTYWAEHDTYTTNLTGSHSLHWRPEGNHKYTYGFSGQEGTHFFKGSAGSDSSSLSGGRAGKDSFLAYAVADIDGDGTYDVITIDEHNVIKVVKDDLA